MHEHIFKPSGKDGYEVCDCGSYHSIAQKPPQEIYENNYWSREQGRSTFEEQKHNLEETETCGISKVNKILEYIPERNVLEIGCSPGIIMQKISERGYNAYGIEPDAQYIEPILKTAPFSKVIKGYFPDVFKGINELYFDFIIAADVFEHVDDYETFLREAHRLLVQNGKLIIMSPIIFEDGLYRECDFQVPEQHCWIFSKTFLEPYLKTIFSGVVFDRWINGHEMFIATK